MGNRDPYFTSCRRCGRQILMTYSPDSAKWYACDPEIRRYRPSGGPESYLTPDGKLRRGERAYDGDVGYRKHRKDCDAAK